jgi:ribosome-associated translation inhibitor RaiA
VTEVAFVSVDASDAVRDYVTRKVEALARDPEMRSCRAVIEADHHGRSGKRFRVKLEIAVSHDTLVVGSHGEAFEDPYAAIDASYDAAKRALHEHAAIARGRRRDG